MHPRKLLFILLGLQLALFVSHCVTLPWMLTYHHTSSSPLMLQPGSSVRHVPEVDQKVQLQLKRGLFTVHDLRPAIDPPKGIVIFGSGDGGWGGWEGRVAHGVQDGGYEVITMNSAAYAGTDYDLATLQADYTTIAGHFSARYGNKPPPLVLSGWSMGAAQAVAAAGGPHPPPHLRGVAVASLLSRGRYGLHLVDKLDIPPHGNGTFGVDDFAASLARVPLVQWHGAEDFIDSQAWLGGLHDRHREYDMPDTGHYFDEASDKFLSQFVRSIDWLLGPETPVESPLHARNS